MPIDEYLVFQFWNKLAWPSNVNIVLPVWMWTQHSAQPFLQPHGQWHTDPVGKPSSSQLPQAVLQELAQSCNTRALTQHQSIPCACSPATSEDRNDLSGQTGASQRCSSWLFVCFNLPCLSVLVLYLKHLYCGFTSMLSQQIISKLVTLQLLCQFYYFHCHFFF